jgi:uncharacterized membrane protein YphA (DoxX/SURF4 family)
MEQFLNAVFHSGIGGPEIALTINRMSVGLFFAIAGYHKLFYPDYHLSLVGELKTLHIPLVRFNQWWVPSVEFSAGCALIVGLLSPLAAMGLVVICAVACCCDGPRRIRDMEGTGRIPKIEYLDDILYLPEALYVIMLLVVICGGPGPYSLDHVLMK